MYGMKTTYLQPTRQGRQVPSPEFEFENTPEEIGPIEEEVVEPEARELFPFVRIDRGQDTLVQDRVVFADFSMKPVSSDVTVETVPEPAPKDESAPEPAASSVPPSKASESATPVPPPASPDAGKPSPSESTSPPSS